MLDRALVAMVDDRGCFNGGGCVPALGTIGYCSLIAMDGMMRAEVKMSRKGEAKVD